MLPSIELGFFASGEILSQGLEDHGDGEVARDWFRTFWDANGSICIQVIDPSTRVVLAVEFNSHDFKVNYGETIDVINHNRYVVPPEELEHMYSYMLGILGVKCDVVTES